MTNNDSIELFHRFSTFICGVEPLSVKLSSVYFDIFNDDQTVNKDFQKLLDVYQAILIREPADLEKAIQENILNDAALRAVALSIIKLWYLGIISSLTTDPKNLEPLTRGGYYFHHEALIWKIAHAHPAGLSGGYFGYWAYKPEN